MVPSAVKIGPQAKLKNLTYREEKIEKKISFAEAYGVHRCLQSQGSHRSLERTANAGRAGAEVRASSESDRPAANGTRLSKKA